MLVSAFTLAAGIGLFLFGMHLLEVSLKNISGRNFKLFLQRITKNSVGAAAGGAIVTAVLQSSSMVSLMVLAFVGAGVFTMKNALAIILGANLGTTIDSWLVATLGFKVQIELAAYPAICIGGLLLMFFNNRKNITYISYFLLGFGLLFLGLSFMKIAMEVHVQAFDFTTYASLPLIVFLGIGFLITLTVQSSSVTMALTLSAIHAGAIGFPVAAAIVLGSETGTTIKVLFSSIGGTSAKKRVALGNLIFNIALTIAAFALLHPILLLITKGFSITDPLIGLVTFSSLINLFSLILFLPFLNPFSRFLERFFTDSDASAAAFIGHATTAEPLTALDLFRRETANFLHLSMLYNLSQFAIDFKSQLHNLDDGELKRSQDFISKTQEENYIFLKQLQGEMQAFYVALRLKLDGEPHDQLNQLISAVRSSMFSVKCMQDIESNIHNLRRSSKSIKFDFYLHHQKETEALYGQFHALLSSQETVTFQTLQTLFNTIEHNYTSSLNDFYKEAHQASLEDIDLTTVLNFNRELFTSNKAMLMALKDYLLEEQQAALFNEIPVYRT
jgi:phosphate:Na+ symporter